MNFNQTLILQLGERHLNLKLDLVTLTAIFATQPGPMESPCRMAHCGRATTGLAMDFTFDMLCPTAYKYLCLCIAFWQSDTNASSSISWTVNFLRQSLSSHIPLECKLFTSLISLGNGLFHFRGWSPSAVWRDYKCVIRKHANEPPAFRCIQQHRRWTADKCCWSSSPPRRCRIRLATSTRWYSVLRV